MSLKARCVIVFFASLVVFAFSGVKATCEDAITNCNEYNDAFCQDYPLWANTTCAKRCGICQKEAICDDVLSNCDEINNDMCTLNPMWAEQNCAGKCKLCQDKCPDGWSYYGSDNSCIKGYKSRMNFNDARKVCQKAHGDLVKVTSDAKADLVYKLVGDDRIWIGVTDIRKEGTFEYVDKTPLTSYHPWNTGQPDNYNGNEDCVHMLGKQDHKLRKWNDLDCNNNISFACESSLECPDGWTRYEADKTCIKLFESMDTSMFKTWESARKSCNSLGGDLVIIRDEKKNAFVFGLLGNYYSHWIGMENVLETKGKEFDFRYVDGSKMGDFHPWISDNPDNTNGWEKCVTMYKKQGFNGEWNDDFCGNTFPYVCSISLV